ncbi:hypothetical protein DOM21_02535 [Bacteriovorax stolpii]|uniref:Uncharacterized protein n=1 Tax=Bacteriovorax stolpii TaxID=960 RepID=A0A2K9NX58_BACTC|nr:hypothetical protein [Bacteriovorax stolpii]AUN99655.1 hypothetical protein C0V70_16380 [Bacteriovorax stolpii]QDK40348.1 hypothetical protein DOM21_02535 [Bacteriovorax stolpii]TDP51286.1 hypothetical protein C8D79_3458 [Bacteriovorax stolpii]
MKISLLPLLLLGLISFYGCSKKSSIPADHNSEALSSNDELFQHPEEVTLYNPNQINAENIKKCAFATSDKDSCKVELSPLLGVGKDTISVNDILNRTMSSQASYLQTFRNILNQMPKESLQMFGAVNAIVISERIVPSFYHYGSGAIYLSSSYFWKTPEEKALIKKKDYREDYGISLQFLESSDYYKNGKSLYRNSSAKYRTEETMGPVLARLLYHELAHANDFFPKSYYNSATFDKTKTYYDLTNERWDQEQIVSQKLKSPLASKLLLKMGGILYQGEKATSEEINTKAYTVVDEFKHDVAANLYGYSTPREDLAMMIEQSMVYHHYGFSAYSIFIKLPSPNFKVPDDFDYPIAGGIKNKIADPKVKERAQDVLEKFFEADYVNRIVTSLDTLKSKDIPEDANWDTIGTYY